MWKLRRKISMMELRNTLLATAITTLTSVVVFYTAFVMPARNVWTIDNRNIYNVHISGPLDLLPTQPERQVNEKPIDVSSVKRFPITNDTEVDGHHPYKWQSTNDSQSVSHKVTTVKPRVILVSKTKGSDSNPRTQPAAIVNGHTAPTVNNHSAATTANGHTSPTANGHSSANGHTSPTANGHSSANGHTSPTANGHTPATTANGHTSPTANGHSTATTANGHTPPTISDLQSNVKRDAYSTDCPDHICLHYLSQTNRARYYHCSGHSKTTNGNCHFMDSHNRQAVALASYPGSGNTWVRGLLQTATGVCTGAIYCDRSLRARGFLGEYVQGGSVLVVKTHSGAPLWIGGKYDKRTHFSSGIFVVRNPLDAMVAEWNRRVSNNFRGRTVKLNSHVSSVGKQWFGENQKWKGFVHKEISRWQSMIRNWVVHRVDKHPVLVIKYEDLKKDAVSQVKTMLEFLNMPSYSDQYLEQRLMSGFDTFQRTHHKVEFEHYTANMKKYVKSVISSTIQLLEKNGLGKVLQMQDYLNHE